MSSNLIPREDKVKMPTNGINLTLVKENGELKKQLALMQDKIQKQSEHEVEYASIVDPKKS